MDNARLEELKKLIASNDFKEENYETLTIEEAIILKNSAAVSKTKVPVKQAEEFLENREKFFLNIIKKKIQKAEFMYCVFSKATGLPFVICDEETFNDQILLFSEERFAQRAASEIKTLKNEPLIMKLPNNQLLGFFTSLFPLGVNEIVLDKYVNSVAFELEQLIKKPTFEKIPENLRPLENPQLVLSSIYFVQLTERKDEANVVALKDLEEEILINLQRGKIIVPVEAPEGFKQGDKLDLKTTKLPMVALPNGKTFLAVCSDHQEFLRFNKDKKLIPLLVEKKAIKTFVPKNADGIIINPTTIKMMLLKERI